MNTRKYKRLYQSCLGSEISDQTWYRIRKALSTTGIGEHHYEIALPLLAKLKKNHPNLSILNDAFLTTWQVIIKAEKEFRQEKITCQEFKTWLINGMRLKPPDSTIYKWFGYANCPYRKEKSYSLKSLLVVGAFAYSWQYRRTKKLESDPIEAEFIEILPTVNLFKGVES